MTPKAPRTPTTGHSTPNLSSRIVLGTLGIVGVIMQVNPLLNPERVMAGLAIPSREGVRFIAFLTALVNIYDILGAAYNIRGIFVFSLVTRVVATGIFVAFGGDDGWMGMAKLEAATGAVLGVGMLLG